MFLISQVVIQRGQDKLNLIFAPITVTFIILLLIVLFASIVVIFNRRYDLFSIIVLLGI